MSTNEASLAPSPRSPKLETYDSRIGFSDSYYIAPPPSRSSYGIDESDDKSTWFQKFSPLRTPITPHYDVCDCVCVTLPRAGYSPDGLLSLYDRLSGVRWLANQGSSLDDRVERVLVVDAQDLELLPLSNDSPNAGEADVESLWRRAEGKKGVKVLLRRGVNQKATWGAKGAAEAAKRAAEAAEAAADAAESGDTQKAMQAAEMEMKVAEDYLKSVKVEMEKTQAVRRELESRGCTVESIKGTRPNDVMKHLGEVHKYRMVVWRAGCWGDRGIESIEDGAFQRIEAHIAVEAQGGPFWQSIVAESCVQGACGNKVELRTSAEKMSIDYCDDLDDDSSCLVSRSGHQVRHVRIGCDILLPTDKVHLKQNKNVSIDKYEDAVSLESPWFF